MARPIKRLAETNKEETGIDEPQSAEVIKYVELVDAVRKAKTKGKSDEAFNQIVDMLDTKIRQISHKFNIPGHSYQDIYQEALFALRFKAIKDYDQDRSDNKKISPFDKFAALCIRRHLSTKLKASYQNKSRVLNSSISLDQNRSDSNSEESLFLSDILPVEKTDVSSQIDDRERRKRLFLSLFQKLSPFEKEVFVLYCRRYSYEEIAYFINKTYHKNQEVISVKSVDNALSRIKGKGKVVLKKYGE